VRLSAAPGERHPGRALPSSRSDRVARSRPVAAQCRMECNDKQKLPSRTAPRLSTTPLGRDLVDGCG
jgi:hypothetical protein